jgi:hypothetical protein
MRTVVAILALLLVPMGSSAKERTIALYDATSDAYPIAQEAVFFRDAGVPLRLIDAEPMSCEKARKKAPDGAIVVCEADLPGNEAGLTSYLKHRTMISLDPGMVVSGQPVCHELMHALTHIPDNQSSRTDSCVWGWLDHPGPFDIDYLATHLVRP